MRKLVALHSDYRIANGATVDRYMEHYGTWGAPVFCRFTIVGGQKLYYLYGRRVYTKTRPGSSLHAGQ